jgi:steroid 5-alpha reductase family enzyme
MFITCSSGLAGAQFASVASPLFVMALLFFVSGIPLQEEQAKRRWGDLPEYRAYRERTNLLAPVPKWLLPWGGACCRKTQ